MKRSRRCTSAIGAFGWVWVAMAAVGCASGHEGGPDDPDGGPQPDVIDVEDATMACTSDEECDEGGECNVGTCRNGACVYHGDHDLCDGEEGTCLVGVCDDGACTTEADDGPCDDHNECTAHMCDATGACSDPEVVEGPCQYGLGTCQGGTCQLETTEKSVFRADVLSLEDPAIMLNCLNLTSAANSLIQDGVDDLELNFVFTFDPPSADASQAPVELWVADCEGEGEEQTISCSAPAGQEPLGADATIQSAGTCLEARDGRYFFGDPNTVEAPCWVTEPTVMEFDLEGIRIPLIDAQAAGTMYDADRMDNGLIVGFLTQETAEAVELPEDIASLLGGETLAEALPPESCATEEVQNVHEGELGWWFHLNFGAARVEDHTGF